MAVCIIKSGIYQKLFSDSPALSSFFFFSLLFFSLYVLSLTKIYFFFQTHLISDVTCQFCVFDYFFDIFLLRAIKADFLCTQLK